MDKGFGQCLGPGRSIHAAKLLLFFDIRKFLRYFLHFSSFGGMSKKMQKRLKSQIYAFLVNLTHLYTQTRASAQVSAEDKPKISRR